ncbi:MAG TPA: transcription elongation factor GreA [Patescibacteria group bacterium]
MDNNQVKLTKEAYSALEKELISLTEAKRPKLVERLSFAMSQGDLAENSDYQSAKEELEFLDGRISELSEVIKNAHIVSVNAKGNGDKIGIGTKVTVKVGTKQMEFNIVGEWEANPTMKKISHTSPLGQVLVGKKVGEKVQVEAPAGKVTYEILSIG